MTLHIVMTLSHVLGTWASFNGFSTVCAIGLITGVFNLYLNPDLPCPTLGNSNQSLQKVSMLYFTPDLLHHTTTQLL